MKILDIKIMRGPNYWSTYRQHLIVMKLDLEDLEDYPTNKIDGFSERIETLLPSLYQHRCSEKRPGGFFERVKKGTWLGHVIEHIALEIQSLAGMPCGFGRTRSTGKRGVYHVVFDYKVESAGLYAAKAAVRIAQALEADIPYNIASDIKELMRINKQEGIGPSTQAIVNEAKKRNIPYRRLDRDSLIMFGQGKFQKIIRATLACTTSSIGMEMASDKEETRRMLSESYVPMPEGSEVQTIEELDELIQELGFPIVIKPTNGNHGRGVKTNITNPEQAHKAFKEAKTISDNVIVERFIKGQDYRFLVIDYKLVAVAKRTPAMIRGDNESTIQELIEKANSDPNRGDGHEKILTTIKVDTVTNSILVEKNLTLNSILPCGEILFLKDTANLSTGGTARDVTDVVHPNNIFLAERIARLMNLDICGIDIMAEDINTPITGKNGAVLEVNAGPGFRMHLSPTKGLARNVAEPVVRMLYPEGSPSRIPIVAVTGTNGKTTTVRLMAHIAKNAGHTVGFTTTDGIYIQDQAIHYGDCSGPGSAEVVLRDPIVDLAVLECARGGILRAGLGFDKCNISIITNISDDHLGLNDIHTLPEMLKVKAVVAHSTFDHGYSILNADDDLVYGLTEKLDCNIALFSMDANSERIRSHCAKGGLAAFIEKGHFVVSKGQWKTRIARITDVPLTFEGKAECMIKNVLPTILAATIQGFEISVIRAAIFSFIPSPETLPGRMNIIKFDQFDVMVDYAHNADGFRHLEKFLQQITQREKIGIVSVPGDRRDEDIRNAGQYAARMFDHVVIRNDKDARGRPNEEIINLIIEGIRAVDPEKKRTIIPDEYEALRYAMDIASGGALIIMCCDEVRKCLDFVSEIKQRSADNRDAVMM
jgi:cyanophycin synthetase